LVLTYNLTYLRSRGGQKDLGPKIGQNWVKIGKNWQKLAKIGKNWQKLAKP
jgi:hypothetical protein